MGNNVDIKAVFEIFRFYFVTLGAIVGDGRDGKQPMLRLS